MPHIASWASPKFAVKVSRIVDEHLIKQKEQDTEITGQKGKISSLSDRLDESNTLLKKYTAELKESNAKNDKLIEKNAID